MPAQLISQLQGETAQTAWEYKTETHMIVAQPTKATQQQQHSSGGDVGGPEEEAPLLAPATLPFLVCIVINPTERLPHRGVASVQRKVEV